jgi:dienelactone hydrolase
MKTQKVEYSHGKNRFIGYLSWNEQAAGKRPGVLVFPDAFGLHDHARERADRLAKLGYVALAADMNGNGAVFSDMAALGPVMQGLFADRAEWRGRARAALDLLLTRPEVDSQRVAAIGHCFGGTTALELARSGAPLSAITTFHAGLLPSLPEDAGRIRSSVLICHGAEDPLVKKEVIDAVMEEFRRDKVDWQFIYYGNTVHSFTNPEADKRGVPGLKYEPKAEARSWAAMRHQFEEAFA